MPHELVAVEQTGHLALVVMMKKEQVTKSKVGRSRSIAGKSVRNLLRCCFCTFIVFHASVSLHLVECLYTAKPPWNERRLETMPPF